MLCGKRKPEELNRFLPLTHRAEGTMWAWGYWKHLTKITGWELWWWNHPFLSFLMRLRYGKQKVQRHGHRCLSRRGILRADAMCRLRHLFSPLMLFLHGEQEQAASVWSCEAVLSTLSHFCPLGWECPVPLPGSLLWTFLLGILPFLPLCGFVRQFIIGSSSVPVPRGLWRSLSSVSSGSFPTNC